MDDILNLLKAAIYNQLATTSEELFEYSIRKLNYFGKKEGVDDFISSLPENHIARKNYDKITIKDDIHFMQVKEIVFIKMIIWEIRNKITDWKFIQDDEDVEKMAIQVANEDISNVENFVNENKNLLDESCNRYKYYFALLYDFIVGKKYLEIAELTKNELDLFNSYNFHDIYKSINDEFFYQDAEDERNRYLEIVKKQILDNHR